jgi:hypothetical protein
VPNLKLLVIILFFPICSFSQNGSPDSPFTGLYQARSVSTPGVYYFNLGGVTFNTYVNNGWVLVANDSAGTTTVLPTVVALSTSIRGVLTGTVLAKFTPTVQLNVTTSDGNINCISSNAALINRVVFDSALYLGTFNNGKANNASWTGSGQTFVRGGGASCVGTSLGIHLDSVLFWPCGDGNGFHWIPVGGYHRESFGEGEAPNTVAFSLWAQPNAIGLPIVISSFQGALLGNNTVALDWTTESELNSHFIIVQKSTDGINWSELTKQNAQGNSNLPVSYSATDDHPNYGDNYYRLEEVDIDGTINYSQIILVYDPKSIVPILYPNPIVDNAYLEVAGLRDIKVYSTTGQDVTNLVKQTKLSDNMMRLNFSSVPKGIFFIRANGYVVKAIVE